MSYSSIQKYFSFKNVFQEFFHCIQFCKDTDNFFLDLASYMYLLPRFSSNLFLYFPFFSSGFWFILHSSLLISLAKRKEGKKSIYIFYSLQFENPFLLPFLMNNNLAFLRGFSKNLKTYLHFHLTFALEKKLKLTLFKSETVLFLFLCK